MARLKDFTLWPFHVDELRSPLTPSPDEGAVDSRMQACFLYPEVKDILSMMSKHFLLAVASRIEDIACAYQMLNFCNVSSYFPLKEIYPSSKSTHLERLQVRSGFHVNEILFFDDDRRNVRDSNKIGVKAVQVYGGLSWNHVIKGLHLFSRLSKKENNTIRNDEHSRDMNLQ